MSRAKRFWGRSSVGVALVAVSVGITGCGETDGFTADQWAQIEKMEPLKGAPPPNPFNNRSDDDTHGQDQRLRNQRIRRPCH